MKLGKQVKIALICIVSLIVSSLCFTLTLYLIDSHLYLLSVICGLFSLAAVCVFVSSLKMYNKEFFHRFLKFLEDRIKTK